MSVIPVFSIDRECLDISEVRRPAGLLRLDEVRPAQIRHLNTQYRPEFPGLFSLFVGHGSTTAASTWTCTTRRDEASMRDGTPRT